MFVRVKDRDECYEFGKLSIACRKEIDQVLIPGLLVVLVSTCVIRVRLAVGKGIGEASHESNSVHIVIVEFSNALMIFATCAPG